MATESDYQLALKQASALYKEAKYKEAWQILQAYKDTPEVQKALRTIRRKANVERQTNNSNQSENSVPNSQNPPEPQTKPFWNKAPIKLRFGLIALVGLLITIFMGVKLLREVNSGFSSNPEYHEQLTNTHSAFRLDLRYPDEWIILSDVDFVSVTSPELEVVQRNSYSSPLDMQIVPFNSPNVLGLGINFFPEPLGANQSLAEFAEQLVDTYSSAGMELGNGIETRFGDYSALMFPFDAPNDAAYRSGQLIFLNLNTGDVPLIMTISDSSETLNPLLAEIILSMEFHQDSGENCDVQLWWDGEAGQFTTDFLDAFESALDAGSNEIHFYLAEMQRIEEAFRELVHPVCMTEVQDSLEDAMSFAMDAVIGITLESEHKYADLSAAELFFVETSSAFLELGFDGFDVRLGLSLEEWQSLP